MLPPPLIRYSKIAALVCTLLCVCMGARAQVGFQYEGAVPCLSESEFLNGGIEITNPPEGDYTFEWIVTSPNGVVTTNSTNNPLGISFNELGCWSVELFIDGTLESEDICGVEIFADPVIAVDLVDVIGCAPFSPIINNQTFSPSGADLSYLWNLGICGSTTNENITGDFCTLNFAGSYPLSLLVEDSNGCFSQFSLEDAVTVSEQPPNVSFTQSSILDCNLPLEVTFASTSSVTNLPILKTWTVDSLLQPENGDTLIYTFNSLGVHETCFEITDDFGCSNTYCSTVEIIDTPSPSFIVDPTVICAGMNVQFENTSTPTPIPTETWDFDGDGITDVIDSIPEFTYPAPGLYNAELVIAWSDICTDSITQLVTVEEPIQSLFELDTLWGCSLPFSVQISDLSIGTGDLSYEWFLADTGDVTIPITLSGNSYTFDDWGAYNIGMNLTNDIGCYQQYILPDTIKLEEPQLEFLLTAPSTCVGDEIQTSYWLNESLDPFVNWYYDIDCDGVIDQEVLGNTDGNTSFTFDEVGTYEICVTAESADGCSETATASVLISPEVYSDFTVSDQTLCGIDAPLFSATNSDPTLGYDWYFGDVNNSGLGPFPNYNYSYCDTGFFDVSLVVSNAGCLTSSTIEDFVYVSPPIANFEITTNCDDYYTVTLQNTSILPDTALLVWTIDGVDMYEGVWEPTHTFTTEGFHQVTLFAENPAYFCSDIKTKGVKINEPTFEVDILTTANCPPALVTIDPLDLSCVKRWRVELEGSDFLQAEAGFFGWNLDWILDEDTVILLDQPSVEWPLVSYPNLGNYSLSMTLEDFNGCEIDSIFQDVINVGIDTTFAQIDSVFTRYCDSTLVCLSPEVEGLTNFQWNTNTGLSSNEENPCFIFYPPYNQLDSVAITLYAEDSNECSSTVTDTLTFISQVDACFNFSNSNPCKEELVTLNADCSVCGAEPCTYNWDLDQDGVFDDDIGIETSFSSDSNGSYIFGLEVIDAEGCVDQYSEGLIVHSPEVSYSLSEEIFACQSVFTFTNTTLGPGISSYWYLDGTDENGPVPISELSNPAGEPQIASFTSSTIGVYNFYLEASNQYDCNADTSVVDFLNYGENIGDFSCILDEFDCAPFEVSCEAFNVNDTDFEYNWNMGDNTPLNTTSVTHSYTSPGVYSISLTMTDAINNCQFSISGDEFEVTTLEYELEGITTVCPGDSSLISNNILDSLVWISPLEQIFQFSDNEWYLTPVDSTLFISIGYLDDCSAEQTLALDNLAVPELEQLPAEPWCENTGTLTFPTVMPEGGIYTWNGESITELNSYEVADEENEFYYEYIDENDCTSGLLLNIELLDTTEISFNLPPLCYPFSPVNLSEFTSHEPLTMAVSYDGLTFETSSSFDAEQIEAYPNSEESYPVSYTYTNEDNCTSLLVELLTVHPLPEPQFSVENTCEGAPVSLISASSIGSGSISAHEWSVNQTVVSSDELPSELVLEDFGQYDIQLVLTSDQQCTDSLSQLVTIHPNPELALEAENVCFGEEIMVNSNASVALGSITETTYSWGDGSSNTSVSPASHYYSEWGEYLLSVTSVSDQNCQTTDSITAFVHPIPVADMSAIDHCFGSSAEISDNSTVASGTITEWDWLIFEEALFTDIESFNHTFSQVGLFEINLEVTSSQNCSAEASSIVQVFPNPEVAYSLSDEPTCALSTITLTDESGVELPSNIAEVAWVINGVNYEGTPLALMFEEAQTVDVSQTVTTTDGCTVTSVQNGAIEIHPLPTANFSLTPNPINIIENIVHISDESDGASGWNYYISDGSTDTIPSLYHAFSEIGSYEVLQVVTNEFNCLDSMLVSIDVEPALIMHVPNAITINNDGINETFYPVFYGDEVDDYLLTIYNRWGEIIFQTSDPTDPWVGNAKNGEHYVPVGVYTWQIKVRGANDVPQEFEGAVTVIR